LALSLFVIFLPQSRGDPSDHPAVSAGIEVTHRERYFHRLKDLRAKRPQDAEATYQIGNLYYSLQMEDEAIKEYRRCLKLDPKHQDAKWFLSHVLVSKGYLEEGFRLAREMLDVKPDDAESYFWAGEILRKMDLPEIARDYYTRWEQILWRAKGKPVPGAKGGY